GYLGAALATDPKGVKVNQVTPNSPAAAAGGLKANDIITAANKQPIKNYEALVAFLAKNKAGTKVALEVLRDGKPMTINITLGERPELQIGRGGPGGAVRGEVTKEGVKVTGLSPRSMLGRAGLQVNDVVQLLDKQKITTLQQLLEGIRNLKPGTKATLTVQRGGKPATLTFDVPQRPQRRTTRPYAFFYGGPRENRQDAPGENGHQHGRGVQ